MGFWLMDCCRNGPWTGVLCGVVRRVRRLSWGGECGDCVWRLLQSVHVGRGMKKVHRSFMWVLKMSESIFHMHKSPVNILGLYCILVLTMSKGGVPPPCRPTPKCDRFPGGMSGHPSGSAYFRGFCLCCNCVPACTKENF